MFWGLGFRGLGLGFGGLGFRVWDLRLEAWGGDVGEISEGTQGFIVLLFQAFSAVRVSGLRGFGLQDSGLRILAFNSFWV